MTTTPTRPTSSSPFGKPIVMLFLGILVGITLALSGVALANMARPAPPMLEILPPSPTLLPTTTATPGPLQVYISGAVSKPDVYVLPFGSIAKDALSAAGGASAEANLDNFNLALRLTDGMQLHVPRINEPVRQAASSPSSASPGVKSATPTRGLVNLNTATLEELDTLPGVGPATAQRLIEARPFKSVDDLRKVSGIGDATFAKLKPLVTVTDIP